MYDKRDREDHNAESDSSPPSANTSNFPVFRASITRTSASRQTRSYSLVKHGRDGINNDVISPDLRSCVCTGRGPVKLDLDL